MPILMIVWYLVGYQPQMPANPYVVYGPYDRQTCLKLERGYEGMKCRKERP